MFLAAASLLVVPYDVAAQRSNSESGIRMDVLWQIIYIILMIKVSIVIPYAYFFYESDMDPDDKPESFADTQAGSAMKYTFAFLGFFFLLLGILYGTTGFAYIPTRTLAYNADLVLDVTVPYDQVVTTYQRRLSVRNCAAVFGVRFSSSFFKQLAHFHYQCATTIFTFKLPVTFPVFVMGFMSFLGW